MFCPSCKKNVLPGVSLCPDCFGPLLSLRSPGEAPPPPPEPATLPVAPPAPPVSVELPGPALRPPPVPVNFDRYPDRSGSLFTWMVAAGLAIALGVGGIQLYRGMPASSVAPSQALASPDLPNSRQAFDLAKKLYAQGKFDEAITQARMALSLLGSNGSPETGREMMELLANAYADSNQPEMAETCYRELLRVYPHDADYQTGLNKALAAMEKQRHQVAADSLRDAQQLYARRDYRQAAESAVYAATLNVNEAPPRVCLAVAARAYTQLHDYRAAVSNWSQVLKLSPHDSEATRGLAQARAQLGLPVASAPAPAPAAPEPAPAAPAGAPPRVAALPANRYPTFHKSHDNEFFGPDSSQPARPRPVRPRRPHPQAPPADAPGGGQLPQLPPLPSGQTAQAPTVPRLPSLSVPPSGNGGSNIPGLSNSGRPRDNTLPTYSSGGSASAGLPGYDTQRGQRGSNSSLPGY